MSFIHFEYDIHKEASGYENSKWLRLLSPLISDKIDLRAELGIPHPLKLFPDNPKLISQSSTAQSEMLRYRYTVRISCKAYEQHTLYLRLKMGYIHSRRDQIENKLFDILADYDYNRVEILRHISDADEDFTKACERILNTANSFADAMPQEGADEVSDTQSNEIILKINFDLSGETAAICAVYGENSREFAEKYHINVPDTAKIISGGEYGKETVIEAELYNMPIYTCFSVEPSLWIVQNENLFGSHNVQVSKEFLFQTETVFLQPLYVHAEYSETLSADGVEQAAEKVWDRLELTDDFKSADAAVTCCFELDTDSEHKLSVRVPAVFLPKAISAANISDSVRTWLALSRRDMQPSALIFKINVYVESNYDSVINAEITVNILKDNNMSDMQIL